MPAINMTVPIGKILVVGPIYDKMEKLSIVENLMPQYQFVIFNGGLCFPSDDLSQLKSRISKMQNLLDNNKTIYLAGRTDLTLLPKLEDTEIINWIRYRPNIAIIKYPTRVALVMDGGIPPGTKSNNDLIDNMEVSFISQIKEKPWHTSYSGGLGYVISNNPLTNHFPNFYSYSMQLGNAYSPEGFVFAQEIDEIGLKKTISL
jgi:hypothetical protein